MTSTIPMSGGGMSVPMSGGPRKRRLTPKEEAFIAAYIGPAKLNCTEAARLAGYGSPRVQGWMVRKRLQDVIEAEELKLASKSKITVEEAETILADIARDTTHKDRLKAVELVLKVHGQLSEKLNITLDKSELVKELEKSLALLARQELKSASLLALPEPSSDKKP